MMREVKLFFIVNVKEKLCAWAEMNSLLLLCSFRTAKRAGKQDR